MALFNIEWKKSAVKELKKLDKSTIKRIISAVENLSKEPNPKGCKKLKGTEFTYRLRVGSYRIIYSIQTAKLIIEIIKVRHRKEVYKNLH